MPIYSAQCAECGSRQTYLSKIADRAVTPVCHGPMTKALDMPMVSAMAWTGHKGFNLPGPTGGWVEDGATYKKFLDRTGFIPESEGAREATIQRTNREAADDKKLEAAVTHAVLSNQ